MMEPIIPYNDSDGDRRKSYEKIGRLYNAIKSKMEFEVFEYLLQAEGDLNYEFSERQGVVPNLLSVTYKFKEPVIFELLLDYGANFTKKNVRGRTIVHELVYLQTADCEEFLDLVLSAHVKFGNFINPSDENGISHFHVACMRNHTSAIELFLQNGIDVNQIVNVDSTIFPSCSPLHLAVNIGCSDSVEMLLKYGANVYSKNVNGMTPVHELIEIYGKGLKLEPKYDKSFEILLKFVINDLAKVDIVDDFGISKFHLICLLQDESLLESILTQITNINQSVNFDSPMCAGYTALHFAAFSNAQIFKLLLENGANIGLENAKGQTPFDLFLLSCTAEDVHAIILARKEWRSIVLSDNKTKLVDVVYSIKDVDEFLIFLNNTKSALRLVVPFDSPLWPGYTLLHLAVLLSSKIFTANSLFYKQKDNTEMVDECLQRGADMTIKDAKGSTALHLAFYMRKVLIVKSMLDRYDKTLNSADKDNLSHYHIACIVGHEKSVEYFLSIGVDVNSPIHSMFEYQEIDEECTKYFFICPGSTALHITAASNGYKVTEILLKYGADVNAKDVNGFTPVHRLICHNQLTRNGRLMLSAKNLKNITTPCGLSHLHVACYFGTVKAVDKLLKLGADINAALTDKYDVNMRNCGVFPFHLYGDPREPLFFLLKYAGYTPLHFSLINDNHKIVTLLIDRNANVHTKDAKGNVPLQNLLQKIASDDEYFEIFKSSVIQTYVESEYGITKLHIACGLADVNLAKKLIKYGANVNIKVNSNSPIFQGCTPLHCAVRRAFKKIYNAKLVNKFINLIQLLIAKGADLFATDDNHNTPFQFIDEDSSTLAHLNKNLLSIVYQSIKHYNFNLTNKQGLSFFHVACGTANVAVIKELLKQNVDVNQTVGYFSSFYPGSTPLNLVLKYCYPTNGFLSKFGFNDKTYLRIIDMLLEKGADINATDVFGNTPLHEIIESKRSPHKESTLDRLDRKVMKKLISHGADIHSTNVRGETPFDLLLILDNYIWQDIELFLKSGCHFNRFNPVTQEGRLGRMFRIRDENFSTAMRDILLYPRKFNRENDHQIFQNIMDHEQMTEINSTGQTAIHNLVATGPQMEGYGHVIYMLIEQGCDINHQDNEGKTALHFAAAFRNNPAITGLLENSADINVADKNGNTACSPSIANDWSLGILTRHIYKLQFCGLPVSQQNQQLILDTSANDTNECMEKTKNFHVNCFYNDLEKSKDIQIGNTSLSIYDFFVTADMDVVYMNMTFEDRQEIDQFFKIGQFRLFEMRPLLRLKYKYTIERIKLVEPAITSLNVLIRGQLPNLCYWHISKYLRNEDLKNVIASTV